MNKSGGKDTYRFSKCKYRDSCVNKILKNTFSQANFMVYPFNNKWLSSLVITFITFEIWNTHKLFYL
jgi:hypothetical protein